MIGISDRFDDDMTQFYRENAIVFVCRCPTDCVGCE